MNDVELCVCVCVAQVFQLSLRVVRGRVVRP